MYRAGVRPWECHKPRRWMWSLPHGAHRLVEIQTSQQAQHSAKVTDAAAGKGSRPRHLLKPRSNVKMKDEEELAWEWGGGVGMSARGRRNSDRATA